MADDSEGPTLSFGSPLPDAERPQARFPVEGQPWGKFLIEKCLGVGGQAAVFQAYDRIGPLGQVALKVPIHPVPPEQVQQWVRTEVDPLGQLESPAIVKVREAGSVDGIPYIATELVAGLPLSAHVKTSPPSLRQILDWMIQLAEAVHHAHGRGIIHRDLKPLNIIITPAGEPRLLDFGFASLVSAYRPGGEHLPPGGTVSFVAPEQARAEPDADHRVDVFALGGILKFLLEGTGPYGDDVTSLEAAGQGNVRYAATDRGPDHSPARGAPGTRSWRRVGALARVANRAIAPDPAQRFASALEMAGELRRIRRRRAVRIGLAGAAALFGVFVCLGFLLPLLFPVPSRPATSLEIHLQRAGEAGTYHILSEADVPLQTGDRIQIHARLARPLVAYLLAASSDGEARMLYPPEGRKAEPVTEVHVPPGRDEWLPISPPAGTETLVLLARPEPLADVGGFLKDLLASGPPPALDGPGLLWVDEGGPRLLPRDRERPIGAKVVTAQKGFLATLLERVPGEWTVVRAIAFPHQQPLPPRVGALAAAEVLRIAYGGVPPAAPAASPRPRLQLEILARRAPGVPRAGERSGDGSGEGSFAPIKDGQALASKVDHYLIVARPLSPGHLYMFQIDSSGKKEWLFPKNPSSAFSCGSNPVAAGQTLQVPAPEARQALYLDGTTGIEHVYAVFSATRWPDLEVALVRAQPLSLAPAPEGGVGPFYSSAVQEPNGLRLRGVGGASPIEGSDAEAATLRIRLGADGKGEAVAVAPEMFEATGSFLVVERWFRHVGPK